MYKNLSFLKCELSEWDSILENSEQSTLFCKSYFLKYSGSKFHLWKVLQGKEIKAVVCINVDDTEQYSIENEFIIHNGIFFKLDKNRILAKKREDEHQIINFVIDKLIEKYKSIFLTLDPSVTDIRPFQWYNFHKSGPKFKIDIKYTSILDISELRKNLNFEKSKIFNQLEPVRRYSIRQAIKEKCSTKSVYEKDNFLILYKSLLKKINPDSYENKLKIVSDLVQSILDKEKGVIVNTYDVNNNLLYSIFCAWDYYKAYYLFGAPSDKHNKPWQGTIGQWAVFRYIVENTNINKFDFEGVNSPKRGWFKLGFGGEIVPYYQVKI